MCYVFPAASAVVTSFIWRRNKTSKTWWLSLMLYGGALFGVIDHLWNGELFLISANWIKDSLLGVVITAGTILAWSAILILAKRNPALKAYLREA
jgi:lipoprotein signal peptidase